MWIRKFAYEHINREVKPAKFICSLAYEIWGYKVLSERCVRQQKNTPPASSVLTPVKKYVLTQAFQKWLKKREFPNHLAVEQIKDINKYLNTAITGAKRHLKMNVDKESVNGPEKEMDIESTNDD